MKVIFLLAFFVLTSLRSHAQQDSLMMMPRYMGATSHYISLNPSFKLNNTHYLGGDLSVLTVYSGCMGLTYSGYGFGYERSVNNDHERFGISAYFGAWMLYFGNQLKINVNWNRSEKGSSLSFRPEFGLSLFIFNFSYGYDFHINDKEKYFNRHNFKVSTVLPLMHVRRRKTRYPQSAY